MKCKHVWTLYARYEGAQDFMCKKCLRYKWVVFGEAYNYVCYLTPYFDIYLRKKVLRDEM